MPTQKDLNAKDYSKNYTNDTGSKYKNYNPTDYDYSNKPPSYPQQNYTRSNKNSKNTHTEKYDNYEYDYDYSAKKNTKNSYTPSTVNYSK